MLLAGREALQLVQTLRCRLLLQQAMALESRVLRVEVAFGLLLGVQVIEIAEELVEAMPRRPVLIAVAEMAFPNWPVV